jgi:hypothetical protein
MTPRKCPQCGELFTSRSVKYCSRACSVKARIGQRMPPRGAEWKCTACGKNHSTRSGTNRRKLCNDCLPIAKRGERNSLLNRKKLNTVAQAVRAHARSVIKHRPRKCVACGYKKFVECCHIVPVSAFDDSDSIGVINLADNLAWLCPNCHWELDHGILEMHGLFSRASMSVDLALRQDLWKAPQ